MARKRKGRKTHTRRRRVSGIGSGSMLPTLLGAVGGYLLGPKINDSLTLKLPTIDPKLIAAGEVLLGVFGPKMIKSKKMAFAAHAIGGLAIGAGAHLGAKSFGLVSGIPLINGIGGYKDLKTIAGPMKADQNNFQNPQMNVISGIENPGNGNSVYSW